MHWSPGFFMLVTVTLNVAILIITDHVVASFLNHIGVLDSTRLTYKVLLYMPLVVVSNMNV